MNASQPDFLFIFDVRHSSLLLFYRQYPLEAHCFDISNIVKAMAKNGFFHATERLRFGSATNEVFLPTGVLLAKKQGGPKMAQPIYKLYMFKPTEAWYKLSETEKKSCRVQVKEALKKVKGKELISCFSGWNSEQYLGWGVEQFPNVEAAQKYHAILVSMNWFRYVESNSCLGTEVPKS